MIKKLSIGLLGLGLMHVAIADQKMTGLDLSGTYICSGYDSHDGGFTGSKLTLALDAKDSLPQDGYGAYHYNVVTSGGTKYMGEASSSGNTLAMYFANTTPNQQSDHGVSIGFVTHDKNNSGQVQTQIHKFYYEPEYEGGGNGSETCVKQ